MLSFSEESKFGNNFGSSLLSKRSDKNVDIIEEFVEDLKEK